MLKDWSKNVHYYRSPKNSLLNASILNKSIKFNIILLTFSFFLMLPFSGVLAEDTLASSRQLNEEEIQSLELDRLEAELDSVSDSVDLLSTLESDSYPDKNTEVVKVVKVEIKPQQCLVSGLKENPQHYSICGDGRTVLDKKTGLMWSRCSIGKTWDKVKQRCEGTASVHNWQEALKLVTVENKNELLGHSDWRLPNIKELSSLVKTACIYPAIDAFTFPEAYNEEDIKHSYWSSSVFEQYPQRAWFVDFDLGHDNATDKKHYKQLRLVRSGDIGSYDLLTDKQASSTDVCVTYPAISFSNVINVPVKSTINSAELEIVFSGIEALDMSIENGEYQVNSDDIWASGLAKVKNNDRVKVRHTSSENFSSEQITTLKVGSQYATFKSTTIDAQNMLLDEGQSLDIIINFNYKSSILTDKAKTDIGNYFEAHRDKFTKIRLIQLWGHTDAIASNEYNQALSIDRALSVVDFLHLIPGLEEVEVEYIGKGKSDPIASNETEDGRAKNRRVSVLVLFDE